MPTHGAGTTAPASSEVRQAHSDDRWNRRAISDASRDFISQRRFQIIAAIIAAGLLAWVMLTT
jgi:hypothetical protein